MKKRMTYLLKLKHDIRVETKVELAKEEIQTLLNEKAFEIESIASLFKKEPFCLINDETVKIIDRMPYLGKIQAFLIETSPRSIIEILKRITLFKELFIIFHSHNREGLLKYLKELYLEFDNGEIKEGKTQITPFVQCYTQKVNDNYYLCIVRGIPFQEIFEDSLEILKTPRVTFAKYKDIRKKIEVQEKGILEGIEELSNHLNNVHDRCPRFGLAKDYIGDYIDWAFSRFRKYALHFIHKHRAKADARMARMVFNLLDVKMGEKVLDPFCGSGSFIADAPMMGVKAYGVDINPLSTLIARVKSNLKLSISELRKEVIRLLQLNFGNLKSVQLKIKEKPEKDDFESFVKILPNNYGQKILKRKNQVAKILFIKREIDLIKDTEIKEFLYAILSRTIVGEFEKRKGIDVEKSFKNDLLQFYLILFTTQNIATLLGIKFAPDTTIITGNTRNITLHEEIDGILTSPPYFDAINYLDVTSIYSLSILGLIKERIDLLSEEVIGSRKKKDVILQSEINELPTSSKKLIEILNKFGRGNKANVVYNYLCDMLSCFKQLYKLLKKNRRMIFVVGKYHHWKIRDDTLRVDGGGIISDLAEKAGFKLEKEIFHTIHKIDAGTRIKSESILIFRKTEEPKYKEKKDVQEMFKIFQGPLMTEVKKFFIEAENT